MTTRLLSPAAGTRGNLAPVIANGRSYYLAPGNVADVPDCDVQILTASGWTLVGFSGTTAQRPARPGVSLAADGAVLYFDTTLSKLIQWDGGAWRDPATGSAV